MARQSKNGPPAPNNPRAAAILEKLRPTLLDLAVAAAGYRMGILTAEDLAAGRKFYADYDPTNADAVPDFFSRQLADSGLSRGEELRLKKLADEWVGQQTGDVQPFIESGGLDDVGGIGGPKGFVRQVVGSWLMHLSGDPDRPLAADFVAGPAEGQMGALGFDLESFMTMGTGEGPGILDQLNLSSEPDGDSTLSPGEIVYASDISLDRLLDQPPAPPPPLPLPSGDAPAPSASAAEAGAIRTPEDIVAARPPMPTMPSDVEIPAFRPKTKSVPATPPAPPPASPAAAATTAGSALPAPAPPPKSASQKSPPTQSPPPPPAAPSPAITPMTPTPFEVDELDSASEATLDFIGVAVPDLELDEAIARAELETLSEAELNALLDGSDVEVENGDDDEDDDDGGRAGAPLVVLSDYDRKPASERLGQSMLGAAVPGTAADAIDALRDMPSDTLAFTDDADASDEFDSDDEIGEDFDDDTPAESGISHSGDSGDRSAPPKKPPARGSRPAGKEPGTRRFAAAPEPTPETPAEALSKVSGAAPIGRKSTKKPTTKIGQSKRKPSASPPAKAPEIWRAPSSRLARVDWDRAERGEDLTKSTIGRVQQAALSAQERETFNFLRTIPLFSLLPDQALFQYVRAVEMRAATIGETVVNQGDPVPGLFLVYNGAVRLFYTNEKDQMVSLGILAKGDIIGEVAVASGSLSPASARCSQDTTLLMLPRAVLERDFKAHPAFHQFFNEYVREFYLRQFIRLWTGFGAGLAPKDLVNLVRQAETWKVNAGSVLYKQGATADCFYVVKKGTVVLTTMERPREGRMAQREVDRIGDGEVFGATELIEADDREVPRRPVGAYAKTDAELLKVPRELLVDLLKQYPELRTQFARAYAENVLTGRDQKAQFDRAGILTSNPAIEQRIDASNALGRVPDFVKAITKEPPKKGAAKASDKAGKSAKGKAVASGEEASKPVLPTGDIFEQADRDASQRGWFAAWRKLRRRAMAVPHVRQHDETDCGAACLAMVAKHYGQTIALARLRDLTKMTLTGASLANLSEAAEAIGFTTKVVRTTVNVLAKLPMPCIANVYGMHYVVVWQVTKKHVIIGDPALGTLKKTREEFEEMWLGQMVMLMLPNENLHLQPKEKWALLTFFPLIRPYRGLLLEVFIASIILDLFGLAMPFFTQTIVDNVIVHENWGLLNIMLVGMLVITIFKLLVGWLRGYLIAHISVKVDMRMLTLFFKHLMSLPLNFFTMRKTGDILSRFGENAKIRQILTEAFISTLLDVMMIVIYITVMFIYNVQLTLALIAFLPLYAILLIVSRPILRKLSNQAFFANAEQESDLVESVAGIGTIKAMSLETHVRWKWEDHFANFLRVYFRASKTHLMLGTLAQAIESMASLVLLWFGAMLVLQGELTIGQLMAFNALLGSVMSPIGKLVGFWDEYHEAIIAIDRLNDVFQARPEVSEAERLMTLDNRPPIRGALEFQNVTFAYDENNVALQSVSLRTEPGHLIALVGRSGCGKTTLTKLLMRLYAPKDGKILVDGHDITSVDIGYLRQQIGIVVQENFLFSGTILDNIALGDPHPSQLKAETAARVACAHQFIARLPFGYETPVGERGLSLSGGERQRLCIARAIYRNPQLLIFDEATSALDYQTEREIMDNIKAVFRDRTLMVIAHRLSTIANAHQIIVLDRGLVREAGNHDELVAKNGLYAHLLRQQASRMEGM